MKILSIAVLLFAASVSALAQNTPGGGTQQVAVDPSGACSVASLMQYNYVNGAFWGCKAGTWTQVSGGGGGSMTWPAAAGITACTGTPCTAWGASLTAPSGALVGTTDTQALTGKTVDGVTPTVFAFLDPTSSVQTQLNGKVGTGTTVNGHALSSNVVVSASDLTTGTLPHAQLPALVSGDVPNNGANTSGTASNVSGTPALPNGTTATTQSQGDGSTKIATNAYVDTGLSGKASSSAATTVNGQTCTLGSTCTISLSAINPQTATYQALAGDFSNYKTITAASGTFTVTLVASGGQPANGQYITVINYGSGVVTIARSGQNINGGTTSLTLAAGSATAPTSAKVYSDGTNYFATVASSGTAGATVTRGVTSSKPSCSGGSSFLYYTTDSPLLYQSNGTTCQAYYGSVPVTPPGAIAGYTVAGTGTIAQAGDAISFKATTGTAFAMLYSSTSINTSSSTVEAEFDLLALSSQYSMCGVAIYNSTASSALFGVSLTTSGAITLGTQIMGGANTYTATGLFSGPIRVRLRYTSATTVIPEASLDLGATWFVPLGIPASIDPSGFAQKKLAVGCVQANNSGQAAGLLTHAAFQ